jgi:hypothetical protein
MAAASSVVAIVANIPAQADQTGNPKAKPQAASLVTVGQADALPLDECHMMRRAISRRVCHSRTYDSPAGDTDN